jgi:hypothetical protein
MISDYLLYLQERRNVKHESIKVQLADILHFFRNNNDEFHQTTHHSHGTFHLMNQCLPMVMTGRRMVQCESSQMKSLHVSMLAAHDTFCRTGGFHDSCQPQMH